MLALADSEQAINLARFFKTGEGQYGYGDKFLGIKVPQTRQIVKECWRNCTLEDVEELLCSEYHEMRLCALLILVQMFKHAKKDPGTQQAIVDFYLAHTERINNWDLVDLSCYEILGTWLLDTPELDRQLTSELSPASQPDGTTLEPGTTPLLAGTTHKSRAILYELARNGRTMWEQRIGMVSCMAFVRKGQTSDLLAIADILLFHEHDLIHKAVGWLLREVDKKDPALLRRYLLSPHTLSDQPRYKVTPRTALRYAIEKFPEPERLAYLHGNV